MSYQVLARKWRPKNFREMVGQEHVLKALINALDHNRLHHAYLFTGTRGVGKTTISRILARCLNCETGVSSAPCGECSACCEINEGRFVDLIEVDAASRTKVEDTRELLDNVQYAPTRGRFKIYLIDEVHMLSNHSFNALLKTLEEPPAHVKFLLATTDPQKLPVTVLSRCLQFNLKNMSPERIVQHLQHVLKEEMVPCDDAALWQLARSADGSMRDALSLTDQAIAFGSGKVSDSEVASMLGTIDHRLVEKLITSLVALDGSALLQAVADFSEHAPDYNAALADLTTLLHRIAIAQALPEALDNSYGDREQILKFAHSLAPEEVQLFYQTALIGRRDLHLAPDARCGFEMVLLRMLAFKPQGVADVPSRALPEVTSASGQSQVPAPSPTANLNAQSVNPEAEQSSRENSEPLQPAEPIEPESAEAAPSSAQNESTIDAKVTAPEKKPEQLAAASAILAELKPASAIKKVLEPVANSDSHFVKPSASEPRVEAVKATRALKNFGPEHWIGTYNALNIKGVMQSTASNCVLIGREQNHLYFALDQTKASLFDESHRQRLADLLSDYFQELVRVEIELRDLPDEAMTPLKYLNQVRSEAKQAAIESLRSDPTIQSLEQQLDAELNEDSVTFEVNLRKE